MNFVQELERLQLKLAQAEGMDAEVTEDTLSVDLTDDRTSSVPLVRFPGHCMAPMGNTTNLLCCVMAFTGPKWMKTSVSKPCCWGVG